MSDTVTIEVLGTVRGVVGGIPIPLGGPKPKLVLARLALAIPDVVSADALIETLWGDKAPASARKTLQKYVSDLRKAIGSAAITTEGVGYRLSLDRTAIDVWRFRSLISDAVMSFSNGDAKSAWARYEEALALWRGDALADLDDVPFTTDEARRLDEDRFAAVEHQIEVGLALGRHEGLVGRLEDLVRRHPLRERLWASLMVALYRSGRQADALRAYRRLRGILGDELGIEPSPDLADLEERILLHDPGLLAPVADPTQGHLPATHTSFIGRGREVADLARLLQTARLITLTGPGGSGKTRLAVEVAGEIRSAHPDGVWFVDLASISGAGQVASTTSAVLGLAQDPGAQAGGVFFDHIEGKRLLLVLDNAEHLVGEVASFARGVVGAARGTTVLTTSREPLGLTGEVVIRVNPLAVPDPEETDPTLIGDVESVRLFVDRAAAANPSFRLTDDSALIVADICRRLDGIPLAIELASRQLHAIGVDELHSGLLGHLDLLVAPGEPDARHRTMEAAIEWSYERLSESQRRLFGLLSVFPGDFTAPAVEHVCRELGVKGAGMVFPALSAMVGRSMVVRLDQATTRYRLLEPMRTFAADRLQDAGTSFAAHRAHALWVLRLMLEHHEIVGPNEREVLDRLRWEHHHLPVALDWAIDHEPELALRILVEASEYVAMAVYRFSWAEELARGIAKARDVASPLRAEALAKCALALAENFADYHSARVWAEDALETSRAIGDPGLAAFAELALGLSLRNVGALDEAGEHIGRAVEAFDEHGPVTWAARSRHSLGFLELGRGNYARTVEVCTKAIKMWEDIGSDWGAGKGWWLIAAAAAMGGDYEAAEAHAERAHHLFRGFFDPGSPVHVRAVQGDAARLSGRFEVAEPIYLECLSRFQEIGDRRCVASTLKNLGLVALAFERPGEAGGYLTAALERRRRLGDDAGIAECLEGIGLVAQRNGEPRCAIRLLAAADRLRQEAGSVAPEPEQAALEIALHGAGSVLSEETVAVEWSRGSALQTDEACVAAVHLVDHLLGIAG